MARDKLQTAADHLESASATASGDASDRLAELSSQLETLAARDTDPDHGRLARIQNKLHDLESDVGDDAAATISDANDAINGFRETLEGV